MINHQVSQQKLLLNFSVTLINCSRYFVQLGTVTELLGSGLSDYQVSEMCRETHRVRIMFCLSLNGEPKDNLLSSAQMTTVKSNSGDETDTEDASIISSLCRDTCWAVSPKRNWADKTLESTSVFAKQSHWLIFLFSYLPLKDRRMPACDQELFLPGYVLTEGLLIPAYSRDVL